jgi:predicted P-loop ATPase
MSNSTQLNKDERLRIAEYGLIALDEIDAMGPRELNVMKSVITASDISERAAYGYTKERRIRLASFCASGNKQEFLTDLTGNRRWLPFLVESITNPFCLSLPYEQIYAQAAYLIEQGFQYWFDLNDIDELEQHNDDFRAQENEEQLLSVYFDIPAAGYGSFMTTAEISDKLVTMGSIKKPMSMVQLGMLLKRNGFQSKQIGTARTRGWLVRVRDMEEVNANRNIEGKG